VRPPESWRNARVTLAIAGATAFCWLAAAGTGMEELAAVWGGFIPARVGGATTSGGLAAVALTPLTSTLVHVDFLHVAFNLFMLLFCGRSVEPIIGGRGIVILYAVGAYAAAAAQWAWSPEQIAPMVGASGAVSALLGGYAMFFGRHRVKIANTTVALLVNALWLAAAWIGFQLLIGLASAGSGTAIATAGHVGGFLSGLLLARLLLRLRWRGA
jgi:membrane associated rhomboid family serine protease